MAVPTSSRHPIKAPPGFYRFLAVLEPLQQITSGIHSILYCGARGDAGLVRCWMMTAAGIIAAALLGFGVTRWYDPQGLHRTHMPARPWAAPRIAPTSIVNRSVSNGPESS